MSHSKLISKLDTVFSKWIRSRDKECITCGSVKSLQCGHFVGRSAMSTRFNEKNCNAQCLTCNMATDGDLDNYKYRLDEKWGEGTADELIIEGKQLKKYDTFDLREMIKRYR